MARLIALALAVFAAGCFDPSFEDTACSDEGLCPSGLVCGSDNHCHRPGENDAGGLADASAIDASTHAMEPDAGPPDADTAPDAAGPFDCPGFAAGTGGENFVYINGHCYVIYLLNRPWNDARAFCAGLPAPGVHLATVTSPMEHNAIMPLYFHNPPTWLGGTRLSFGQWHWITSDPWNFAPWDGGEPNGSGEQCLAAMPSGWRDEDCARVYSFICEVDP